MLKIDYMQCEKFARVIRNVKIKPDPFTNPEYFPPSNEPVENVVNYFFFMVAIDHRTSLPGKPFEGYIDGKFYHGSDLLYRLGMIMYEENPDFFSPENMSKITADDIRRWLTVDEPKRITIHDPEIRAFLLRDAGTKLLKLYDGSILNLLRASKGYLYLKPNGGFIERLKIFRAYEDPVEKKPFLLTKFLERRGVLKVMDSENMHVPVDNHLVRIALRTGIVDEIEKVKELFMWKREATYEEDIIIRLIIRQAWKIISKLSEVNPSILDDFLWMFGRKTCLREKPMCEICPLKNACKAFIDTKRRQLYEHLYYNTWYY